MAQWYTLEEFEAHLYSEINRAIFIVWEYEEKAIAATNSLKGNNGFRKMMSITDSIRNLDTTIHTLRDKSTKEINLVEEFIVYCECEHYLSSDEMKLIEEHCKDINWVINKLSGFFNMFYPKGWELQFNVTEHSRGIENKKVKCHFTINIVTTDEID